MASVIDTTVTDYNQLLNANSYQKASWFLHMLNEKIGEDLFQNSLKEYHRIFKDSTVLTSDFQKIVEKNTELKLNTFFNQWLMQPGFPLIKVKWKQKKNNTLKLKISQKQKYYTYSFPLEIEFQLLNGENKIEIFKINKRTTKASLTFHQEIKKIELDPHVKLLYKPY